MINVYFHFIPLGVFLIHMAEELPRFPAWASRHFGYTSLAWYVYSHIVLVIISISVAAWAAAPGSTEWSTLWNMALMATLVLNAAFHLVTTILFKEYSPGVITGLLCLMPAGFYMFLRAWQTALLTENQLLTAAGLGTAIQVLVLASLWLNMNIDWKFRLKR